MPPASVPTPGMALSNFAVVLLVAIGISSLAALTFGMAFSKRRLTEQKKRKLKALEKAEAAKVMRKQHANDTISEALEWYNNGNGDGSSGKISLNKASKKFGIP